MSGGGETLQILTVRGRTAGRLEQTVHGGVGHGEMSRRRPLTYEDWVNGANIAYHGQAIVE